MTYSDQRHCGATQPLADGRGDWICTLPSGHDGDHAAVDGLPDPHRWPRIDSAVSSLGDSYTSTTEAVGALSHAIETAPGEAPLLAIVDLVAGRAHLIAAQRLIDRGAQAITATEGAEL